MTMWAVRDENSRAGIRVSMNYGPIQASCTEDIGHLRSVWSELGRLIEDIDSELAAKQEEAV